MKSRKRGVQKHPRLGYENMQARFHITHLAAFSLIESLSNACLRQTKICGDESAGNQEEHEAPLRARKDAGIRKENENS